MWFKNAIVYKINLSGGFSIEKLRDALAQRVLQPCSGGESESRGWIHVHNGECAFAARGSSVALIAMGVDQKLLPSSVVNSVAKDRIAQIEEQQGFKVGRKQAREIKELVTAELLPKAFSIQRNTYAMLDFDKGMIFIDAASTSKAEDLLSLLHKTVSADDLSAQIMQTKNAIPGVMTGWMAGEEIGEDFSIDRELELRNDKTTVRYVNHNLGGEDIHEHISSGKHATRIGLTWLDRVSFVMTESGMHFKRLKFLDITKEGVSEAETSDEVFEAELLISSNELRRLTTDVIQLFGGLQDQ